MDWSKMMNQCRVIHLEKRHIPAIYKLCAANTAYYHHMGIQPTPENLEEVLTICPPGSGMEDKHFLGFFNTEAELIAILDLYTNYPGAKSAFIGWFMVRKTLHRKGIGKEIILRLFLFLKSQGFRTVELGCIKSNLSAMGFWTNLGFTPTGAEQRTAQYTVIKMAISLHD